MKKITGIAAFLLSAQLSFSQNLRNNKFDLPVVENEIAFLQFDTLPKLTKNDFYAYGKEWLAQTFNVNKFDIDNKQAGELESYIRFKIDDANIKEPLNYTAKVSLKFIDGIIRFKFHDLKYTTEDNRKEVVDINYRVQQQMRARTDALYPDTWNSLKDYSTGLLENFKDFMEDKSGEKL
ncbi:hypothetical protein A9P82_13125 [Arachidicoccus ginsenosidimutans]|uniref:hypothetical protein n=1 Tax=Arachidicoccus sp. BS20 TaxID=1850526 RepID=UPI0007F0F529|nr:hypothetical protein [Arachidicoccus sp. BS20]ANI90144.1 hypothetical protein A9P82_13125 [Arachidicoccus sp. BS20]